MRMKGVWAATLALVLVAGAALSGCTGAKNDAADSGTSAEPVVVKFSYPPFGYSADAENAFWTKHIAAFEKENPGIKIEMTTESWDNIFQKTAAAVESGNVPDISYNSPPQIMPLAQSGDVMPVDDVIADLGGVEAFQPALYNQFVLDGKVYCVPNCDNCPVLAYRKDMLKAAGYDTPPATWDELIQVAKATTKGEVKGLGLYLSKTYDTRQVFSGMMWAAGGSMLDKDGNVVIDSPENLAALKYYTEFYTKYKVVPEAAKNWQYGDNANIIGTGQVAMTPIWGGYGTLIDEMFPDQKGNIGFAELPKGPTGHSGSWSGVGGFFIFTKAQHPDEAKVFIEYMSQPEIHKEWCLISGNVSPFTAIASDPELTKYEWYKAIADQSPNAVQNGWIGASSTLGLDEVDGQHMLAEAIVDVTSNGTDPAVALKKMHDMVATTLANAQKKAQ